VSLALVAAGGLFVRGAMAAGDADPGFSLDRHLIISMDPSLAGYDAARTTSIYREALDRVRALAGVESASYASIVPFGEFQEGGTVRLKPADDGVKSDFVMVGSDYFATLGIAIRAGRAFEVSDRSDAPRVAIVDERVARIVFGDTDPIGQSLVIDSASWRVVGVAAETRPDARRAPGITSLGEIYLPLRQRPSGVVQCVLHTQGDPLQAAPAALRVVHDFDRDLAVTDVQSFANLIHDATTPYRILTGSMISFAIAAACIALIGLYALIAFLVAQRMREFGIRCALGADARRLFGLVLGESAKLAAIGVGIGLMGALGAGRVMRAALVDVSPADPLTLGAVVGAMLLIATLAALGPARRAAHADPMSALRSE